MVRKSSFQQQKVSSLFSVHSSNRTKFTNCLQKPVSVNADAAFRHGVCIVHYVNQSDLAICKAHKLQYLKMHFLQLTNEMHCYLWTPANQISPFKKPAKYLKTHLLLLTNELKFSHYASQTELAVHPNVHCSLWTPANEVNPIYPMLSLSRLRMNCVTWRNSGCWRLVGCHNSTATAWTSSSSRLATALNNSSRWRCWKRRWRWRWTARGRSPRR